MNRLIKKLQFGCQIDTAGTEFWVTCKWLAFLNSFSCLQVIQNKRPWCLAAAYVTARFDYFFLAFCIFHSRNPKCKYIQLKPISNLYKVWLKHCRQVAAGSNQKFTGHIDGVDNIFSEKLWLLFSKANKLRFTLRSLIQGEAQIKG